MNMEFVNCYGDANRADAYATLEFANTYYLAYRDLAAVLTEHARGTKALDFGCGTGRSTRLLRKLGFEVTGVDISEDMLRIARGVDPSGDYRLVPNDCFDELEVGAFDLVLSAFTFDNIRGAMKTRIFRDLTKLLTPAGIIVSLVSSPQIYTHEWASFSAKKRPSMIEPTTLKRAAGGWTLRAPIVPPIAPALTTTSPPTNCQYTGPRPSCRPPISAAAKPQAAG